MVSERIASEKADCCLLSISRSDVEAEGLELAKREAAKAACRRTSPVDDRQMQLRVVIGVCLKSGEKAEQ